MQRLVRPEAAKHGQIARLRVLAGGGIGDADGIKAPLLALWGAKGTVGKLWDVLAT
jgi:hypothetical protein